MEILKKKIRFRIIFIIDALLLLFVQIVQGASLNYYFIRQFEEYFTTYFLFILDFFCLGVFSGTFFVSYNHFMRSRANEPVTPRKITGSMERHFPKSTYGVLPLSYVSWIIYVAILITKLSIIFGTDIAFIMVKEKHLFSAQILQVSVAMSSIVFMLLVEGHNWHKKSSECYSYVTAICKKTGIEVFDSVEMLDYLIMTDQLSTPVENAVFVLASINFILPTISLYVLNISDFGKNVTPRCFPLRIIHNVLRLVLIDVPFFAVRLRTWIVHQDMSVFMMKNFFYILLAVRELYLDIFMYFKPLKSNEHVPKTEEIPLSYEQTQTDGKNYS